MKTPMSSDTKLTKYEECESVDSTKYRGMIEAPKSSHLEAVKRIFRYIKGTTHLGLWYPKGTDIETVVYVDSDHAEDYVDRKSTSGKDWKDKKKQKRSKTDKKREKDKESRARQRIQPEIAAGSARHSQTQSKKETKKSKTQITSQGAIVVKFPKTKGLILKI
ncbi:hypothetical protein Tco_0347712 [Tanacetum coccineum]